MAAGKRRKRCPTCGKLTLKAHDHKSVPAMAPASAPARQGSELSELDVLIPRMTQEQRDRVLRKILGEAKPRGK